MSQGVKKEGMGGPRWHSGAISSAQRRARADYFVGREAQLNDFANRLDSGEAPRIVFVHGPGGIGKSSLLDGFREIADNAGCGLARLDARQLAPAPHVIGPAVTAALDRLPASHRPRVLAIDHIECWAALDGWLRGGLLPDLPADLILVLAGRSGPGAVWRADPGVAALLIEHALAPLPTAAAARYLRRRGIECDRARAVQAFARGHPLALALAADQALREPDGAFVIERFPELVRALLQWLLCDVEHPEELAALQACATVRRLDEPLLAAMLARENISPQFDWLAHQHYAEPQAGGLVIHDLVREIVIGDLRSRNLGHHHGLIRRAIHYLMASADTASEHFRVKTVPDIIYTLRQEAHVRDHLGFGDAVCYPDAVRGAELADLAETVQRLEGVESRAWFDHWARAPASEVLVMRDAEQKPAAFALFLRFDATALTAAAADPCLQALNRHLEEYAPLRAREQVLLARFRMACDTHQALTPVWAELSAQLNGRMFTPGISLFASVADLGYRWSGMEENAEYRLLAHSEYRIDGRSYMISAHDLRREPALAWAYNSIERVLRGGHAAELKPAPIVLLDYPAFAAALRHALRHFRDDGALADNALLRTPMLRRYADRQDPDTLRAFVEQTSAGQAQCVHEILNRVYFRGSSTKQQAIAFQLHISERTLRRRLRHAQAKLTDALWQRDTRP